MLERQLLKNTYLNVSLVCCKLFNCCKYLNVASYSTFANYLAVVIYSIVVYNHSSLAIDFIV